MISIIVPVYKVEKYLTDCIESVMAQTYKDWELLLIDDGSPDACPQICDEYAAKDNRISVFHKENGGVSSARNLGLDKAGGEWVLFVDADDILDSNTLEVCICNQFKTSADVVCFSAIETDINGTEIYRWPERLPQTLDNVTYTKQLFNGLHEYSICWKMFRRSYIGDHRFTEGLKFGEDVFFWTSLVYNRTGIISITGEYLYFYRRNEDSVTQSKCIDNYDVEKYLKILRIFYKEALEKTGSTYKEYFMRGRAECVRSKLNYQGWYKSIDSIDLLDLKESRPYMADGSRAAKMISFASYIPLRCIANLYLSLIYLPTNIKFKMLY